MFKIVIAVTEKAIKNSAAYKTKLLFYSLTGIIQFFIYFALWKNLSAGEETMLTYFVLSFTLQSILPRWIAMDIGWAVKRGEIATTFLYPISFRCYYFFHSIGDVLFTFSFMGIPVLTIAVLSNSLMPCKHIVFFALSCFVSYGIAFLCFYLIGLISFRLTSIWGIFLTFDLVYLFLSGAYIPIKLMPFKMQLFVNYLPFRYIIDLPILMWQSEQLSISAFMIQLSWLLCLYIVTEVIFKQQVAKLDIFGG